MRTYLLHNKGRGQMITLDPRETSAEEYGRIQSEFARKTGSKGHYAYAAMVPLYPDCTANGVPYHEELAGPGGMSFILYQTPGVTDEDIRKAKATLRESRDVVYIGLVRIKEWIEVA